MMDQHSKNLSEKLFDILEVAGASEESRLFSWHAANALNELFNTYVFKEDIKICICGGSFEGSYTPAIAGDTDIVVSLETPLVVFDMEQNIAGISYLAEQSDHYPGYVKLKLLKDGIVATKDDIDCRDHGNFEIDDTRGCMFLKHSPELNTISTCLFRSGSVHGPANALVSESGEHLYDIVSALKSLSIPPFANLWLTRIRQSDWPSSNQLEQMGKMGCLFVAIGHPDSPNEDILWRISFVLQERFLMSSLNETQHKVYVLLKVFKKEIIESQIKDSISSYNLKTCLLNYVEDTPAYLWKKENIIECFKTCLRNLYKHLENTMCPSFFVREQNLFERDKIRKNRDTLLNLFKQKIEIKNQKSNSEFAFLYDLKSDNMGAMLLEQSIMDERRGRKKFLRLFQIKQAIMLGTIVVRDLLLFQIRPFSHARLKGLLSHLLPSSGPNKSLEDANAYIVPWLELRVGLSLASQAVSLRDHLAFPSVLKMAFEHVKRGFDADLVNSRLATATILLQLDRYQECLSIVQELKSKFDSSTTSVCCCDRLSRLPELGMPSCRIQYEPEVVDDWGDKSINEINTGVYACCFTFLPCDEELVPKPLTYEMECCKSEQVDTIYNFHHGWVTVDAKIYVYTLLYLVGAKSKDNELKSVAINQIKQVLQHDKNQGHKHVTYNILGWIMMQEDKYLAAVKYFLKSWEMRSGGNAAMLHVRELFHGINGDNRLIDEMLQFVSSAVQLI